MAWNGLTILDALRDGAKLTRQLAAVLNAPADNVRSCLRTLVKRGLIRSSEGVNQITEAGREALASGREVTSGPCNGNAVSRRFGSLRAKAWRAMRMKTAFSLDDLLMLLCDGSESDAEGNLRSYVNALESAGYLFARARRGEGGQVRWSLDRDTGPEAPSWNKKTRVLRDHNTGEVFDIPKTRGTRRV